MAIINLICESCGGNVELDDTQEFGFYKFCKAEMLIKSDTIINKVTQNMGLIEQVEYDAKKTEIMSRM